MADALLGGALAGALGRRRLRDWVDRGEEDVGPVLKTRELVGIGWEWVDGSGRIPMKRVAAASWIGGLNRIGYGLTGYL